MSRFFSDEAYEQQVDPFNAGEPVMPWDDPSALHDEGCELPADSGYTAEEKPRDDYRAPERPAAHRDERPAEVTTVDNSPTAGKSAKRPAAPSGKPGCIRGVYMAVMLVILVMILFSALGSCVSDVFMSAVDNEMSDSNHAALDYSQEQADADEQAIADAVAARMDKLADDPTVIEMAKQGLDEKLESYVGYTAEELGIDADAYAAWFLSQMSYQISYAYSYDDGTGAASLEITSPLAYKIASDFYSETSDYLMANKLYGSYGDGGGAEAAPLTSEQQNQMRGFFANVLAATEPSEDGYMNVAASKDDNGTWQLDEQDIQDELSYLLGAQ